MRQSRFSILRNQGGHVPLSDERLAEAFRLPDYVRVGEALSAGRDQIRKAIKKHIEPLRIPEGFLDPAPPGRRAARRKELRAKHPDVVKGFEAVASVRRGIRSMVGAILPTLGLSTSVTARQVAEKDLPAQIRTRKSNPWIFLAPPYGFHFGTHDMYWSAGHGWDPDHLFDRLTGNVGWETKYDVEDAGTNGFISGDICDRYQGEFTSEVGSKWTSKKKGIPTAWVKWVCRKSKSACTVEDLAGYSENFNLVESWFTFSFTKHADPDRRVHKFWSQTTDEVPDEDDDTFTYTSFGGRNDQVVWLKIKGTKEIAAGEHTAFAGIDMLQIASMDDVDVAWEVRNNWKVAEIDIEAPE